MVFGAPDDVVADFFSEFGDAHLLANHLRVG